MRVLVCRQWASPERQNSLTWLKLHLLWLSWSNLMVSMRTDLAPRLSAILLGLLHLLLYPSSPFFLLFRLRLLGSCSCSCCSSHHCLFPILPISNALRDNIFAPGSSHQQPVHRAWAAAAAVTICRQPKLWCCRRKGRGARRKRQATLNGGTSVTVRVAGSLVPWLQPSSCFPGLPYPHRLAAGTVLVEAAMLS